MPTTLTISLTTTERLFFDETWPLERLFLGTLARVDQGPPQPKNGLKPYTLSPFWPQRQRGVPASEKTGQFDYQWRVCLLDDQLTSPFLAGLDDIETFDLNGHALTVGRVKKEAYSYEQLAGKAQARAEARSRAACYIDLVFLTPAVLHRDRAPMPLPDPMPVFHHYLLTWDTFAPRELWVNINVLDAIEVHLALVEHQLETRQVRPSQEQVRIGFLGRVTYKMMAWEKLGAEFLGTLHMLAHFANFCGTGELTQHGLGQTRYQPSKGKR